MAEALISAEELIAHVEASVQLAEIHRSKLSAPDASEDATRVLELPGFSGLSTRHFLNNLCSVPLGGVTRYLEVRGHTKTKPNISTPLLRGART